jgi:hypothetical protein
MYDLESDRSTAAGGGALSLLWQSPVGRAEPGQVV